MFTKKNPHNWGRKLFLSLMHFKTEATRWFKGVNPVIHDLSEICMFSSERKKSVIFQRFVKRRGETSSPSAGVKIAGPAYSVNMSCFWKCRINILAEPLAGADLQWKGPRGESPPGWRLPVAWVNGTSMGKLQNGTTGKSVAGISNVSQWHMREGTSIRTLTEV